VDGLTPATLEAIKAGIWMQERMVLPATVRAVLAILKDYQMNFDINFSYLNEKVLIIGQSDLLGKPLYWHLKNLMKTDAKVPNRFGQTCQIVLAKAHKGINRCEV
jgi:5,10-methylene-tetrahydrofolate dehydrogenase/methenyl tetrahydrofolate cyclohydrolase